MWRSVVFLSGGTSREQLLAAPSSGMRVDERDRRARADVVVELLEDREDLGVPAEDEHVLDRLLRLARRDADRSRVSGPWYGSKRMLASSARTSSCFVRLRSRARAAG